MLMNTIGRCFLLGFSSAAVAAAAVANLPPTGFPLGRDDLVETRTVTELRPGLTHVHVERGAWPKEGPPKESIIAGPAQDRATLTAIRDCLEQAGYAVREHQLHVGPDSAPYYALSAGDFDTVEEVKQAARKLPCGLHVGHLTNRAFLPDWDTGPWTIDIVTVDPKVYRGKVVSAWSGTALRESPLELARKRNAVVATNGSFFEYSIDEIAGVPTGISIVEGQWHHEAQPPDHRAAILFLDNTTGAPKLSIGYDSPPFPELKWANGQSVKLDGLDRMPRDNELVAMRPGIAMTAPISHGIPSHVTAMQIGVDGYLSRGFYYDGPGLVLLATGSRQAILEDAIHSGEPVELDLRVPGRPGLNAYYVVPVLMNEGKAPQMDARRYLDRTSRTALGADAAGKIYLISVDGARILRAGSRFGVSLAELQAITQFLGLTNAGNLDGGPNSTSMVIDGKLMGYDTDGHSTTPYDDDRRVADMVLVIDDAD